MRKKRKKILVFFEKPFYYKNGFYNKNYIKIYYKKLIIKDISKFKGVKMLP